MAGSSGSRQGGGGKSAKRSKSPSNLAELKRAINPAKGAWKGKSAMAGAAGAARSGMAAR